MKKFKNSSWQNVSKWYSGKVGEDGSYFHKTVIFPKINELIDDLKGSKILDLGCGEGVLSRELKGYSEYLGYDLSSNLVEEAKKKNENHNCKFIQGDVSKSLEISKDYFTHAFIILALQNIENYLGVFENASKGLKSGGKYIIVLNHPYFRIPKSTSWEIDYAERRQYRKVSRYMSEHKIRIDMTPGSESLHKVTYSFHRSLSQLSFGLNENGFEISLIDEWNSEKVSHGKYSDMENFARDEIPMFMCIIAVKR